MGQALYRKYRPKSFGEVIGQDHIVDTLKKSIKSGRVSHAYLFTGPRGTGKTSIARILAHEVNGIDYVDESIHLDIIEIDAASNRRIDEIRDLRDKVHIAPTSSKYKVYIIDEVHMLTKEAFNALLKTLEEPPKHCIFILATTEVHKLPETIISRTQRFEFKPVNQRAAAKHLAHIAKSENIDIDKEALEILAEHGGDSMRDSISLLDQMSSYGSKITVEIVEQSIGLPSKKIINSLLEAINRGGAAVVINLLNELKEKGSDAVLISSALSKLTRLAYINGFSQNWQPGLIQNLLLTPTKPDPDAYLEILLIETAVNNRSSTEPATVQPVEKESEETIDQPEALVQVIINEPAADYEPKKIKRGSANLDNESWNIIVEKSKEKATSIYTALRLAEPEFTPEKLILKFEFPLHQKKVNQTKYKDLISALIEEVTGSQVIVEPVVDKDAQAPARAHIPSDINAISNIFPDAEMLES